MPSIHSFIFFLSSSLRIRVSIMPGLISSVMSTPAYFKAVTYNGSLMPLEIRESEERSLSGVVSRIMEPSPISTTLSTLLCSTSSILCSTMMMVAPVSLCIWSISSIVFFPEAGSRFANGSSKRNISTLSTITPARDTLCFCPPDSSWGA